MAAERPGVLFLCTGNSARSILAEALLRHLGRGRFFAYSAGSHPLGTVNPLALELLAAHKIDTAGLRSKSWDEFAGSQAPRLDFVFTVCGNAEREVCPIWHGTPLRAHWGMPDPAAVRGSDAAKRMAFTTAYEVLAHRIEAFIRLPLAAMSRPEAQRALSHIAC